MDLPLNKKTLQKLVSASNEAAASKPSKFAKAHLEKLGWTEGDGLGKNRQGMATHVKVVKKDDLKGLGHRERESKQFGNPWWDAGFNDALKSIQVAGSSSDSDSESDSDLEESAKISIQTRDLSQYTEEDRKLFLACGGRRCGKRAGRLQAGKMLREHLADQTFKSKLEELKTEKGQDAVKDFHVAAKQSRIIQEGGNERARKKRSRSDHSDKEEQQEERTAEPDSDVNSKPKKSSKKKKKSESCEEESVADSSAKDSKSKKGSKKEKTSKRRSSDGDEESHTDSERGRSHTSDTAEDSQSNKSSKKHKKKKLHSSADEDFPVDAASPLPCKPSKKDKA